MRRLLLPALLLLSIAGHAPQPEQVLIDSALVQHLLALETWAANQERFEYVPLDAMITWESSPPELIEQALVAYAPIYSELDALWQDPASREHLKSGLLFRAEPARLMGARVCMNLLAGRAVHEARDLGDYAACESDFELLLAYSHSLGRDDIGFMVGWAGEGIARFALQRLACSAGIPDSGFSTRIGARLGTFAVPFGYDDRTRKMFATARATYERQATETRELLVLAAR